MAGAYWMMQHKTRVKAKAIARGLDFEARKIVAIVLLVAVAMALLFAGQRWQAEQRVLAGAEADAEAQAQLAAEFTAWQQRQSQEQELAQLEVAEEETPAPIQYASLRSAIADLVTVDYSTVEMAEIQADERRCLAEAIYYESAYEPLIGQMAVADVVLNRVASAAYPDSVCGVVYQGSHRVTGCQFSFTCDGALNRQRNHTAYARSEQLAGVILAGMRLPVSKDATHYHADYVSPYWAPRLIKTTSIGTHKFYKYPNRKTITTAAR